MGEARFRVEITERAADDFDRIDTYRSERSEAWRGEKYYHDLRDFVFCELSDTGKVVRGVIGGIPMRVPFLPLACIASFTKSTTQRSA